MADASLGTAVLRTRLDTTGLKTGLDQAKTETDRTFNALGQRLNRTGAHMQQFGAAMTAGVTAPIVAAGAAAVASAVKLGNYADRILDLEQMTGLSTNTLQEFEHIARAAGVGTEVLAGAAEGLTRRLRATGDESKAFTENVAALGISTRDAYGELRDMDELMPEFIARLSDIDSITERNAISMQVFGRRATELAPVLALGADEVARLAREAHNMGQVLDRGALEAANAFRIEWENLRAELGLVGREVTTSVLPVVKEIVGVARDDLVPVLRAWGEQVSSLITWWADLNPHLRTGSLAIAGIAASVGPVSLGLGTIIRQLPALRAGLAVMFGPAGLVVLGATAVAGLALALHGNARSLTSALSEANDKFASGDKDSMVGALDAVIKQVNGPTKEALVSLREELITTGDVGVEQAQRILMHMQAAALDAKRGFLGTQLFGGPSQLNTELARAGGVMGIPDLGKQIQSALNNNDLITAINLLNDAMVALDDFGLPPRMYQAIADFHADVANITSFSFTPTNAPGNTPPGNQPPGNQPPGNTPPGVTPRDVRTAQDVWNELGDLGLHAINVSERLIASGVDEAEATIEQLSTRRGLLISARDELLHGFYDDVTDAELEYLQNRITAVDAELAALRTTPRAPHGGIVGLPDALDARASSEADAAAGILVDVTRRANVQMARDQMEVNARNREAARAIAADTEQAMADAAAAHEEYLVSIGHTDSELERFKTNADNLATALKKANDETARQALFAGAQERYGIGDTGLAGTSAAPRGPGRDSLVEYLTQNVRDAVTAYQEGAGSIEAVEYAVNALTNITPMSVLAINDLTEGVLALERAAALTEQRMAAIKAFDESPGSADPSMFPRFLTPEQQAFNARLGDSQHRPRQDNPEDLANARRINQEREAQRQADARAAENFQDTVIKAGIGFADTLVQGIKTGDLGSIVSGAFGAGASIIGAIPGIGTLGTIISGLLPIFGGLLGGLFGGGGSRDAEERRRREQQQARSVPAININFQVTQHNQYNGAPSDPVNEQAFSRQADALFESIYRRHLGPRLDRIEQRLGIAGA